MTWFAQRSCCSQRKASPTTLSLRDPKFAAKNRRIQDLHDRVWQGRPLPAREFIISADDKSSIQAPAASNLR